MRNSRFLKEDRFNPNTVEPRYKDHLWDPQAVVAIAGWSSQRIWACSSHIACVNARDYNFIEQRYEARFIVYSISTTYTN